MSSELQAPLAGWPKDLVLELTENQFNGAVGQELVSETQRVRVWSIRLKPSERIGFHRHVLDYFWTAITDGRSVSHYADGSVSETTYVAGDTKHLSFGPGQYMIHDLQNVGNTALIFSTVEFLDSVNTPLPIPDGLRRRN